MPFINVLSLALAFVPLASFVNAGNQGFASKRAAHYQHARNDPHQKRQTTFKLVDNFQGGSFFENFDFFTEPDPTHGLVNYVDGPTASSSGLTSITPDGVVQIKVDNSAVLQSGENRNSVRIQSKNRYNGGLFLFDATHIPTGCSTWPAFYLAATDSPAGGEIHIVEGANTDVFNTMTLHSNPGCTIDTSRANPDKGLPVSANTFTGTVETSDCNAGANNFNTGCSIQDTDDRSFGSGLNGQQGGVYATLWDDTGIRIWFFPRDSIPQDIANSSPNPSSWPAPQSFFAAATCPPDQFFKSHSMVFEITLCGDWASSTYAASGCPGTCADHVANPANFNDAHWKINYISVYQPA